MLRILFLCTGNSCRSQMAEGLARYFKGDIIEPYSAGIETHGVNALAVSVMQEIGIDIAGQRSKHVEELKGISFDYVVTVCAHAHESCPSFHAGTQVVHVGFDDPPQMAALCDSNEEKINCYRRVRDEIKEYILSLPDILLNNPSLKEKSC